MKGSIPIKAKEEIEIMKEGGKITAAARRAVLAAVRPGIKTKVLDRMAEKIILKAGGEPSFKTIRDYRFTTCINLNDGIVHGIPGNRKIQEGDLVTIDLGTLHKGLHTDSGWTEEVKSQKSKVKSKFLEVGERALEKAIGECRVGNYLGDVSNAIQETIEGGGYTVIRDYIGHGVGRDLHEPPEIPGFGKEGTGPKLEEGMVLAIEVIYTRGSGETRTLEDGWTVVTTDGSDAALFEHSIAITDSGPIVLTK